MRGAMYLENNISLGLLVLTIVNILRASDAGLHFKYSVLDWRKCDTGNKEYLMIRNIPIQECLLECRVRISCQAVMFLTIRRECGLLERDAKIATEYNSRPCVFIRMTDVEDIIHIPTICQTCSTVEACDIEEERCVIREKCELKWTRIEQSCYHLLNEKMTADEADVYCSSKRAHLVYIETAKENSNIQRFLENTDSVTSSHAWIGIADAETEGVWTYTNTNLNVTFTDWATGQPDNGWDRENCGMIYFSGIGWNDAICSRKILAICENRLQLIEAGKGSHG